MKLIVSACLICFGYISLAQSKFKLESVYVLSGKETLLHGNQQFKDFISTFYNGSFFLQNDSSFTSYSRYNEYNYRNYSGEVSFRKEDSKWRFVLGASWNQRIERSYYSDETYDFISDTVYAPVPYMHMTNGEPVYGYTYDNVYVDSIVRHQLFSQAKTQNIFVSAEILRDFKKNKYTFSGGLGLGVGMSLKNEIVSTYSQLWGLQMVQPQDNDYVGEIWYADIPDYNPTPGTHQVVDLTLIDTDRMSVKGNTLFMLRPYIPLRVEAQFAEQGFFSRVGIVGSLNAGAEFQFVQNDAPRTRLFWNYRAGLFFRI
jgi:hypothetical protein